MKTQSYKIHGMQPKQLLEGHSRQHRRYKEMKPQHTLHHG